ncbi:uncharacterized protein LOC143890850 [Tasmannia lanceolata]|uniref:uncharacterized protein LOC143890850 n=1 Tax=Tasmannia lanceolata TaxID=3420 RepID=UPI0040640509
MPRKASWAFRNILRARDLLRDFGRHQIGQDKEIDFWTQSWHPDGSLDGLISRRTTVYSLSSIKTLDEIHRRDEWNPIIDNPSLSAEKEILKRGLFQDTPFNMPIRKPEVNGMFTVKSAWNAIRKINCSPSWANTTWFSGHIPKHAITTWKAIQLKLLTKDHPALQDANIDASCVLCNAARESINHLFFDVVILPGFGNQFLGGVDQGDLSKDHLSAEEEWIRNKWKGKYQSTIAVKLAFAAAVHRLWTERNQRIFENKSMHKTEILRLILRDVRQKMSPLNLCDLADDQRIQISINFGYRHIPKEVSDKSCRWLPPIPGECKLNTDASLSTEGGGIRGIIRNDWGDPVYLFSLNVAKDEIFTLEIQAICEGIVAAKNLGITSVD